MRRMAIFLVFLLLVFTFNAYACLLPLQTVTRKDCSSNTDKQARQTCDAFLVIGPQSQPSTTHAVSSFTFECAVPCQSPDTFTSVFTPASPPRNTVSSIHLSISATVLRI